MISYVDNENTIKTTVLQGPATTQSVITSNEYTNMDREKNPIKQNLRNPLRMNRVKFITWNAAGLSGKVDELVEVMIDQDILFAFVCETWLKPGQVPHPAIISSLTGPLPTKRVTHQHHGIAIVIHPYFICSMADMPVTIISSENMHAQEGSPSYVTVKLLGKVLISCAYLSPSLLHDAAQKKCTNVLKELTHLGKTTNAWHQPAMIMGDFNMRLGALSCDTTRTARGRIIHEYLQEHGFNLLTRFNYACSSFHSEQGQSNVDFVYGNGLASEITEDCKVMDKPHLGSDHSPILTIMNISSHQDNLRSSTRAPRPRQWNLHLLRSQETMNRYREVAEPVLKLLQDDISAAAMSWRNMRTTRSPTPIFIEDAIIPADAQKLVDTVELAFTETINLIAEAAIGSRTRKPRKMNTWYMTEEMYTMIDERRRAYDTWQRARRIHQQGQKNTPGDIDDCKEIKILKTAYLEQRRSCQRLGRRLIKEAHVKWMNELEQMETGERARRIKGIAKKRNTHQASRLDSTYESIESYRQYYQSILTPIMKTEVDEQRHSWICEHNKSLVDYCSKPAQKQLPFRLSRTANTNDTSLFTDAKIVISCAFTSDNIRRWIDKTGVTGKAPGMTLISMELLRPCSAIISDILRIIFSLYYELSCTPSSWKKALICPIFKKGDPRDICNYRPISLTETSRKIYERCLDPIVKAYIEPLHESQNGFRTGRSCIDHLAVLQHILTRKRTKSENKVPSTIIALLDIKNAYDKVDRNILWEKCAASRGRGQPMPNHLIMTLKALFDQNESQVVVDGKTSTRIMNTCGLLQGSVLSPTLYSCYVDDLPHLLEQKGPLISLNNNTTQINSLLFADDIALIAENVTDMEMLLGLCESHSHINNYRFAPTKCELIIDPVTLNAMSRSSLGELLQLYGTPLRISPVATYLGCKVKHNGIEFIDQHISQTEKVLRTVHLLHSSGFSRLGLSYPTKIELYRSMVRPIMEYTMPILPSYKKNIKPFETAQHQSLSTLFGVSNKTSNISMRGLTALPTMSLRQHLLNAKWLEHVKNLPKSRLVKQCYDDAMTRQKRGTLKNRASPFYLANANDIQKAFMKRTLRSAKGNRAGISLTPGMTTSPPTIQPGVDIERQAMIYVSGRTRQLSSKSQVKANWKRVAQAECRKEFLRNMNDDVSKGSSTMKTLGLDGVKPHPLLLRSTIAELIVRSRAPMPQDQEAKPTTHIADRKALMTEMRNLLLLLLDKYPGKPTTCKDERHKQPVRASSDHVWHCARVNEYLAYARRARTITSMLSLKSIDKYGMNAIRTASALCHRMLVSCLGYCIPSELQKEAVTTIPITTIHPFTVIQSTKQNAIESSGDGLEIISLGKKSVLPEITTSKLGLCLTALRKYKEQTVELGETKCLHVQHNGNTTDDKHVGTNKTMQAMSMKRKMYDQLEYEFPAKKAYHGRPACAIRDETDDQFDDTHEPDGTAAGTDAISDGSEIYTVADEVDGPVADAHEGGDKADDGVMKVGVDSINAQSADKNHTPSVTAQNNEDECGDDDDVSCGQAEATRMHGKRKRRKPYANVERTTRMTRQTSHQHSTKRKTITDNDEITRSPTRSKKP